jgi:hypothetical protein
VARAQCHSAQVAVDGVMRKFLRMLGQVCQGVVNWTAQEKLALIQFAKAHSLYGVKLNSRFYPAYVLTYFRTESETSYSRQKPLL